MKIKKCAKMALYMEAYKMRDAGILFMGVAALFFVVVDSYVSVSYLILAQQPIEFAQ
jgi:hypothetical protein